MTEGKRSNRFLIVVAVVGGVLLLAVVVVGVLAAVGIAGVRSYLQRAKAAEGQNGVTVMARGMVSCAESKREQGRAVTLPPSAPPVPATLSDVSGRKYASSAADWSAEAYDCAKFSLLSPQYFQYEWQLETPSSGRAIARADLDGDGKVDHQFSMRVTCSGETCTTSPLSSP